MTKKLTKYEENRQNAEENITAKIATISDRDREQKALLRLGAAGAIGRLAQNLNAQTIRALQSVRDEKDFESLGFTRFDDYLNESEASPMSYSQFNDREKLLLQEGDQVFDLLNSLKLSRNQRRLLGAGHVQVDEKNGVVLIVTGEDLEEQVQEIALTDRTRLLQTLSAVVDQAALLNQKNAKQKTQIQRGETQVEELKKKLDEAKNRPGSISLVEMFVRITSSIDAFAEMVKKSEEEMDGDFFIESINDSAAKLENAFRKPVGEMTDRQIEKHVANKVKKMSEFDSKENEFAEITSSLGDEELAALMD